MLLGWDKVVKGLNFHGDTSVLLYGIGSEQNSSEELVEIPGWCQPLGEHCLHSLRILRIVLLTLLLKCSVHLPRYMHVRDLCSSNKAFAKSIAYPDPIAPNSSNKNTLIVCSGREVDWHIRKVVKDWMWFIEL